MFRNYIKIAFRNLWKDKIYSTINILGLALGMTCLLLILAYMMHELSYDKHFADHDRIHRIAIDIKTAEGDNILFAPVAGNLAEVLHSYPQVESVARLIDSYNDVVVSAVPEKKFYEKGFYYADPSIFDVFSFEFLHGDPSIALAAPKDMVITREKAEKYFNSINVVGRTLKVDSEDFRVTGVIENLPEQIHFQPDMIASLVEFAGSPVLSNWHATMFYTYVKLKKHIDPQEFESQIYDVAYEYVADEIENNSQGYRFFLQPLTSIHLHSDLRYELGKNNSYQQLQILGAVALIILVVACFNFINIATARAARRAKEVGIRKAVGSTRRDLIRQFLFESLMMCFIALLLALVGVELLLPVFRSIADIQVGLNVFLHPGLLLSALGILVLVGLLAGSYPALVLSGFQPQDVLKGQKLGGSGSSWLRNTLVTAQFTISILLIVATIVVSQQLKFMQSQDLGFDKEQMLIIRSQTGSFGNEYTTVKNELKKNAFVQNVAASNTVPGQDYSNNLITLQNDKTKSTDARIGLIDNTFLETYQIPVLAGRSFSISTSDDSLGNNVLINRAMLSHYGWETPEEALGATFGGGWGTVIGVVENFNFTSLQTNIQPLLLAYSPRRITYFSVKMKTDNYQSAIAQLQDQWKTLAPNQPFEYYFLDEDFDRQYRSERRLGKLFTYFAILAIFIACLGLLGLSAYITERRTKEIGIRKVLGASVNNILLLVSKDFLLLIAISFVIATPIGLYVMNRWLADFAYRIQLHWWMFALAGILALAIAIFTISFQALRAANANPVKSLRAE